MKFEIENLNRKLLSTISESDKNVSKLASTTLELEKRTNEYAKLSH